MHAHQPSGGQSRRTSAGGLLVLALCLAVVGVSQAQIKTLQDPTEPISPLACTCSDVDPRSYFTRADVEFTCFEQASFGQCDQPFMRTTQIEITEGYCQISCGRCPCCESLAKTLDRKGFGAFLWLLNFTDVGVNITRPGYMATLIAPYDGAVDSALSQLGFSSRSAAANDYNARNKLASIARLHVLPPVPGTRALWTSPFMGTGTQLPTVGSQSLTATRSGDGSRVKLATKTNSGWLYDTDTEACKGFVQAIDTVLLP